MWLWGSNTNSPSNQNSNLAMEAGSASNTLIPAFHIHQPFQIRIFRNMSVSLSPWCPETHPALNLPALARANSPHLQPAKWHLTAPGRLNPVPRAAASPGMVDFKTLMGHEHCPGFLRNLLMANTAVQDK